MKRRHSKANDIRSSTTEWLAHLIKAAVTTFCLECTQIIYTVYAKLHVRFLIQYSNQKPSRLDQVLEALSRELEVCEGLYLYEIVYFHIS